jgi:flavodoxin
MEVIMDKALVAYFSATGNTKEMASKLSKVVEGNLHEIVPKVAYTADDLNWKDKESRSSKEMNDKSYRPEISDQVENIDDYDTIYLGYPIW